MKWTSRLLSTICIHSYVTFYGFYDDVMTHRSVRSINNTTTSAAALRQGWKEKRRNKSAAVRRLSSLGDSLVRLSMKVYKNWFWYGWWLSNSRFRQKPLMILSDITPFQRGRKRSINILVFINHTKWITLFFCTRYWISFDDFTMVMHIKLFLIYFLLISCQ